MHAARKPRRLTPYALSALIAAPIPAGAGLAPLADPAAAAFPGKSGRIAFASDRATRGNPEGDFEISTINPGGSDIRQLTKNKVEDNDPAWSADGGRLAFARYQNGNGDIWTMRADGADQTRRTGNDADDFEPTWSPNGKLIAFRTSRGGNTDVSTLTTDGGNQTNRSGSAGDDYQPDWQPRDPR